MTIAVARCLNKRIEGASHYGYRAPATSAGDGAKRLPPMSKVPLLLTVKSGDCCRFKPGLTSDKSDRFYVNYLIQTKTVLLACNKVIAMPIALVGIPLTNERFSNTPTADF
jgi:hypothetical protein